MLKQRILTGLILAVLAGTGIYTLPFNAFAAVALLVIVIWGGREWFRMTTFKNLPLWMPLSGLLLAAAVLFWLVFPDPWVLVFGSVLWCFIAWLLWQYQYQHKRVFYGRYPGFLSWMSAPVLLSAWYALAYLDDLHYGYVFFLISLIACADIAAYFSGRRFGHVKLAPALSPGKTREGCYGGLIATFIWAAFWGVFISESLLGYLIFISFSMLAVVMSVAGDLFESLMKRQAGIKDSGRLLPGHGGILDRIDSLLAATPVFALGLLLMQGASHAR